MVNRPGTIFVREFLPAAVYSLLRRTKVVAAWWGYKHVWIRSGEVCVRKLNGSDIVFIRSDLYLKKLEWLEPFSPCFGFLRQPLLDFLTFGRVYCVYFEFCWAYGFFLAFYKYLICNLFQIVSRHCLILCIHILCSVISILSLYFISLYRVSYLCIPYILYLTF